jgi:hypothetical protein
MPIIPPPSAVQYDSVTSILNAAKVRLKDRLDTLFPVNGKILENSQPFSQQMTNNAWRALQESLANLGYTVLKQEAIIQGLPVVATTDPAVPCYIDTQQFYDGVNLFPGGPVLPSDIILPLKVWERPSGQNACFIRPMELFFDGLPGLPKQVWNGGWEWRAGTLYLPGAQQVTDLRLLYARYLSDFIDIGNVRWYQQLVPIPRCQTAFSLFVCAEADIDNAEAWLTKADGAVRLMANRESSMKQRGNVRRQSRSGRMEGGWGGFGWY